MFGLSNTSGTRTGLQPHEVRIYIIPRKIETILTLYVDAVVVQISATNAERSGKLARASFGTKQCS